MTPDFEQLSERQLLALQERTQEELDALENSGVVKRGVAAVAKVGVGVVGAVTAIGSFVAMKKLFVDAQEERVEFRNDELEQTEPSAAPAPEYFGALEPIEGKLSDVDLEETIVTAPCRNCFCGGMGGVCRPVKATDERDTTVGYEGNVFRRLTTEQVGEYLRKNPDMDDFANYQRGFSEKSHFRKKFDEIQERLATSQGLDTHPEHGGCCGTEAAQQEPDEKDIASHQVRQRAEQSQTVLNRQYAFAAGASVAAGAVGMTLASKLAAKLPQNRIKALRSELYAIDDELGHREKLAQQSSAVDSGLNR